jgi:hypothetical protein
VRNLRRFFEPSVDPLARQRLPPPPPELAAKVIAAARIAGTDLQPGQDWIDRLWESSLARLLWTVVTFGLLFAAVAEMPLPMPSPVPVPRRATPAPVASALTHAPELTDLAAQAPGLLDAALRPGRSAGGARSRQLAAFLGLDEEDEKRDRNRDPRALASRAGAAGEC